MLRRDFIERAIGVLGAGIFSSKFFTDWAQAQETSQYEQCERCERCGTVWHGTKYTVPPAGNGYSGFMCLSCFDRMMVAQGKECRTDVGCSLVNEGLFHEAHVKQHSGQLNVFPPGVKSTRYINGDVIYTFKRDDFMTHTPDTYRNIGLYVEWVSDPYYV
jgi:hypothetical protein